MYYIVKYSAMFGVVHNTIKRPEEMEKSSPKGLCCLLQ